MNQVANIHRDRAMLLSEQRRYADAERELRQALAITPGDYFLHALLAVALVEQKKYAEASASADQAVGLGPDMGYAHYVRAMVLEQRNRLGEAEGPAQHAIALEPESADNHALLASIRVGQRRWADALDSADRGLSFQPDHAGCLNLRGVALTHLGKKQEAIHTIDGLLARDPDNAVSHANRGWALLHQGEHRPALEHFREALRLNPEMEWAQAGIVEALKARHLIYRLMLRYFLWMSRLGQRAQWAIVVGGFLGFQWVGRVARQNPELAPYTTTLLIAYCAFALMTWLADPLFNLMLRLNRFGRLILSARQRWASNVLGILLLLAAAALIAGIAARDGYPFLLLALVLALLTVPASTCFKVPAGWPTPVMAAGTALFAAIGLALVAVNFAIESTGPVPEVRPLLAASRGLSTAFFWGFLICQFGGNYLRTVTPTK